MPHVLHLVYMQINQFACSRVYVCFCVCRACFNKIDTLYHPCMHAHMTLAENLAVEVRHVCPACVSARTHDFSIECFSWNRPLPVSIRTGMHMHKLSRHFASLYTQSIRTLCTQTSAQVPGNMGANKCTCVYAYLFAES
jgi:hypothetical protein